MENGNVTGYSEDESHRLTRIVIGAAIEVHRTLGPGLLESTYSKCLAYELQQAALQFEVEAVLPVEYKGALLDCGYRVDVLINRQLIVELKAVDRLSEVHQAQILTYMKLACVPVGLLMNFNVRLMREGICRFRL